MALANRVERRETIFRDNMIEFVALSNFGMCVRRFLCCTTNAILFSDGAEFYMSFSVMPAIVVSKLRIARTSIEHTQTRPRLKMHLRPKKPYFRADAGILRTENILPPFSSNAAERSQECRNYSRGKEQKLVGQRSVNEKIIVSSFSSLPSFSICGFQYGKRERRALSIYM